MEMLCQHQTPSVENYMVATDRPTDSESKVEVNMEEKQPKRKRSTLKIMQSCCQRMKNLFNREAPQDSLTRKEKAQIKKMRETWMEHSKPDDYIPILYSQDLISLHQRQLLENQAVTRTTLERRKRLFKYLRKFNKYSQIRKLRRCLVKCNSKELASMLPCRSSDERIEADLGNLLTEKEKNQVQQTFDIWHDYANPTIYLKKFISKGLVSKRLKSEIDKTGVNDKSNDKVHDEIFMNVNYEEIEIIREILHNCETCNSAYIELAKMLPCRTTAQVLIQQ